MTTMQQWNEKVRQMSAQEAALRNVEPAPLARPLKVLVLLIMEDLEAANQAGLEHYRAAGEKLQEAKGQSPHGQWGKWLTNNFGLSQRTAERYMRLAGRITFATGADSNSTPASNFKTVTAAGGDNRRRHDAPLNRFNVEVERQHAQSREKERRLQCQLGLQLIDVGYKTLATKLHPDRGGSAEAMPRLNRLRDLIRDLLKGAF